MGFFPFCEIGTENKRKNAVLFKTPIEIYRVDCEKIVVYLHFF